MPYNHTILEEKWQRFWEEHATFRTPNISDKPKKYILDMFPYPSGTGLHVGHPKGYTATDIIGRYYHAKGYNVLHPMGFDAFGLPAENFAIKTGTHPKITTKKNIETFIAQLKTLGFAYDWDRMIDTTDPEYYRWTQWIFLELFKKGLAYEQDLPINYCPHDKTGLANEEVINGCCERCGTPVERRAIRQWVLRITDYAERLIDDLDDLDWSESVKDMQRNWIGRSEGCEFEMKKSDDEERSIRVYTTRIDTVYGMTYAVIAPDHPDVMQFVTPEQGDDAQSYVTEATARSDQERTNEGKEKTGVFTGSYVINPFNGQSVPLWIADYVLGHYGTGAVMAVPAHDERDFEFAKRYGLPIVQSIDVSPEIWEVTEWKKAYAADGIVLVSGRTSEEARREFANEASEYGFGCGKVNYKLRDWLFSRQRYWGEPIPLIHLDNDTINHLPRITDLSEATDPNKAYVLKSEASEHVNPAALCSKGKFRELVIGGRIISPLYDGLASKIVIDTNLPLVLPEVEKYEPAGDGQSPLAAISEWVNVTLASNLSGKRETNTMPQWGGSCWYYLRYMDPNNSGALAGKEALDYWQNVDEYVGGTEHAVLHLLYARFWHKVLYDLGVVPTKEPFQKLTNQGMVLAYAYERPSGGLVAVDLVEEREGKYYMIETGEEVRRIVAKMSKSLKNTANPLDISEEYGADTLRLYEMSIGDFRDAAPWNPEAIIGSRRFLDKVYSTYTEGKNRAKDDMKTMKLLHKTLKKVEEDIVAYKFNTAISAMIILMNEGIPEDSEFQKEWKEKFAIMLHPFAPHMSEEIWSIMDNKSSIFDQKWPEYDDFMLIDDEVIIAVQVNGKLRGTLTCFNGVAQEEVSALAFADPNITKWTEGKILVKEIFIPNKMISIVVKDS